MIVVGCSLHSSRTTNPSERAFGTGLRSSLKDLPVMLLRILESDTIRTFVEVDESLTTGKCVI